MASLLLTIVILGFVAYLIEAYIPMSPPIAKLFRLVVVVLVIIFVLRFFGVDVALPKL